MLDFFHEIHIQFLSLPFHSTQFQTLLLLLMENQFISGIYFHHYVTVFLEEELDNENINYSNFMRYLHLEEIELYLLLF